MYVQLYLLFIVFNFMYCSLYTYLNISLNDDFRETCLMPPTAAFNTNFCLGFPGQKKTLDQQCQLVFGASSTRCTMTVGNSHPNLRRNTNMHAHVYELQFIIVLVCYIVFVCASLYCKVLLETTALNLITILFVPI